MTAHHGNTPAAWTAVTIILVGFVVGGLGLVLSSWLVFWIGVALAPVGVIVGKVMQMAGMGPIMMRKIMALFDEYQSRENAKHTLRAMKENARQGFWNGSRPPLGYRVVVAEERGAKLKKKLEIDPIQADKIRLIYKLALFGVDLLELAVQLGLLDLG